MEGEAGKTAVERLEAFVGEWSIEMNLEGASSGDIGARVNFEWGPGEAFLIERCQVPIPEAPDGIAIIGWDEGRATLLQHYFDSRGVTRVYEMSFEDGVWKLERSKPDFSDFEFAQRYSGKFSDDGKTIEGTWEIAHDKATFEKDFDMNYKKVS